MAPDEEAEHRDPEAREGDETVAEDVLPREAGDELADHPHAGQDHDVDRGVRVEPEEMLEEDRIATQRGVEDAHVEHALDAEKSQHDGQYRGAEHLEQA